MRLADQGTGRPCRPIHSRGNRQGRARRADLRVPGEGNRAGSLELKRPRRRVVGIGTAAVSGVVERCKSKCPVRVEGQHINGPARTGKAHGSTAPINCNRTRRKRTGANNLGPTPADAGSAPGPNNRAVGGRTTPRGAAATSRHDKSREADKEADQVVPNRPANGPFPFLEPACQNRRAK